MVLQKNESANMESNENIYRKQISIKYKQLNLKVFLINWAEIIDYVHNFRLFQWSQLNLFNMHALSNILELMRLALATVELNVQR